ncbi:MAG: SdpI family protein, partial [Candidatus Limnocylindrus sp.]
QLPADAVLAVHWNINGVADGFAGREALLFIPITAILTGGLLWLAVRYDPKRANIARSSDAIGLVVVALALLVAVTQSAIINSGFGEAARLDFAVPIVAGAFIAILGYAMPNIRQNYTIGVRLPWTIESEAAWDASHRFIGGIWILVGVLTALLGYFGQSVAAILTLLIGLTLSSAGAVFVAYRVYRREPRSSRTKRRR